MLKIIIQSDQPISPAVRWITEILKFKVIRHKVTPQKIIEHGKTIYITVIEKKP